MTQAQLRDLEPGDIIRNVGSRDALMVTENLGDHCVAVRTMTVTNPQEWILVSKAIR